MLVDVIKEWSLDIRFPGYKIDEIKTAVVDTTLGDYKAPWGVTSVTCREPYAYKAINRNVLPQAIKCMTLIKEG